MLSRAGTDKYYVPPLDALACDRQLQGWNSEKSEKKYNVVRSIFLAKEVLFSDQKKYILAVNRIRDSTFNMTDNQTNSKLRF